MREHFLVYEREGRAVTAVERLLESSTPGSS
jgi:hypothetical protein